jgi:hypothetical protein
MTVEQSSKQEADKDLLCKVATKPSTLCAAMLRPSSRAPTANPAISLSVNPSMPRRTNRENLNELGNE